MEPLEKWRSATVSDLARRAMVTLAPSATVREAIQRMRQARSGCVLVVRDRTLTGIFTERDVLTRVFPAGDVLDEPVETFMTPDPAHVAENESTTRVVAQMIQGGYRHLPILDSNRAPVGVISIKSMVAHLADFISRTVYTASDDGARYPHETDGA
jgi:CBS domain-containing protein